METVKELKKMLADEQTAHALTKTELANEKAAHVKTIEEAAATVADVTAKLASSETKSSKVAAKKTVKVADNVYEISIQKFSWNGESKTAADIKADSKLAEELVAEGFGGLVLISK